MDILKPPTDSLYKFLAVLGLLFFITSVISPVWMNQKVDERFIDWDRDAALLNLDAETWSEWRRNVQKLTQERDAAHKRLNEANEALLKSQITPAEARLVLDKAKEAVEKLDTKLDEFDKILLDWDKQKAQVNYKHDLLDSTRSTANRLLILCLFGGSIGLVMATMGFMLWYKRTQKPEDLILKKKSEDTASPA